MGVKILLPNLPGGDMESTITGFEKLKVLRNRSIDIDSGTLIYTCAFRHRTAYNAGDYLPAVREFQRTLIVLTKIEKWNINTVVFDGVPPEEKAHEHRRRRQKADSIVITSTFIAMCVKVCKKLFINYVVAPQEADMQVCRRDDNTILVCRDSDGVAYGHTYIVKDAQAKISEVDDDD
jgi:5'-3' exonuclease